ncbi:MAG: hypothetical protein IJZ79_05770 [Bacilli bacterium]|nr:hypothetical protein [Bacilli bacterium]
MKKIQLVTYNPLEFADYNKKIEINDFNKLKSLDNYDINIFNLNSNNMWENKETTDAKANLNTKMSADFKSINQMINNSKKSINIICLPQNLNYYWKCYSSSYSSQLKDMLPLFIKMLEQLIPIKDLDIIYENSLTMIKSNLIPASFYINNDGYDNLTSSSESNKITTIKNGNLIITSLEIIRKKESSILFDYLMEIDLIKEDVEYPDWVYKYEFNDDIIQNNNIEQAKEQIKLQKEIIDKANQKLQQNLHYKSILYNNSNALVTVVFEILEYIFDISLADFNDEQREDFLFVKDDITFIGEIKGVTSNVKYEHISQLEVHYSKYLDNLQEQNKNEKIKKILIMNYERTKDIMIRDEINQMQIDLAKKNETLIIDTKSLLSIYEKTLQGELEKTNIIDYIKNNSGLIELDKVN